MRPGGQRSASSVVFTTLRFIFWDRVLPTWSSPLTGIAGSEAPGAASFLGWQEQTITPAFHRGSGDPEQQALHSPSRLPSLCPYSETACLDFFFCFVLNIVNYLGIKVAKVTLNLLCSPVDPKLTETLLFRPPKCWDHEHMPPCPACSLRFWCVFPANGCCAHGVPTDCCPEILFLGAASQAFPCFNVLAFSHPFVDVLPHELPLPFLWQIHKNQLNGEEAYLACSWRPVLYPQWESREK